MRDKIKVFASGQVTLYKVTNGVKQLIKTSKNEILPNAASLVALNMSGDSNALVDKIRLYLGAALVTENPSSLTRTYNEAEVSVTFEYLFVEGSLDGDIDNAKLGPVDSVTLGDFAQNNFGETVSVGVSEAFFISWKITFTNLV